MSQRKVADRAGIEASRLNEALNGKKDFRDEWLRDLDPVIGALNPDMARTGGLASFAAKLRADASVPAHVPSTWVPELLEVSVPAVPDRGMAVVSLLQGSALVDAYRNPDNARLLESEYYRRRLGDVVDRLLLIGASPPSARSVEALFMIGNLARYAFPQISDQLEKALHEPLGFRVWRAFTTIVRLCRGQSPHEEHVASIKEQVYRHLRDSLKLRERSLYPARSLDLELALAVPPEWAMSGVDWARKVLAGRANNDRATARERALAATGLWERAVGRPEEEATARELRDIIDLFEQDDSEVRDSLHWAAATLRQNIERREPVCNEWPSMEGSLQEQLDLVITATDALRVPFYLEQNAKAQVPKLLASTKVLVQHAVLQNAGVYRRRAIDTLRVAGWGAPAAEVLSAIAGNENTGLRARALFAIGFLMDRDPLVERVLREACTATWERLDKKKPTRDLISETHAALFAVGDCFGAIDSQTLPVYSNAGRGSNPTHIRDDLQALLDDVVKTCGTPALYPIARAACYLVSFTGHKDDGSSEGLLRQLRSHEDEVTRNLSSWALEKLYGLAPGT